MKRHHAGMDEKESAKYLRVVAMSAANAKAFFKREDEPVDLGPADPTQYKAGARVYGYRGNLVLDNREGKVRRLTFLAVETAAKRDGSG